MKIQLLGIKNGGSNLNIKQLIDNVNNIRKENRRLLEILTPHEYNKEPLTVDGKQVMTDTRKEEYQEAYDQYIVNIDKLAKYKGILNKHNNESIVVSPFDDSGAKIPLSELITLTKEKRKMIEVYESIASTRTEVKESGIVIVFGVPMYKVAKEKLPELKKQVDEASRLIDEVNYNTEVEI